MAVADFVCLDQLAASLNTPLRCYPQWSRPSEPAVPWPDALLARGMVPIPAVRPAFAASGS